MKEKTTGKRLFHTPNGNKATTLCHFISQVNRVIVKVEDEQTLFQKICDIAVKEGGFSMAWIGSINEKTKVPELVACQGGDMDFLSSLEIKADKYPAELNNTFISVLLRENTVYSNDMENDFGIPWQAALLRPGYHSTLAVPLRKSGKVIGSFNLYTGTKNFFDIQEIDLLEQAAEDISYGLDFLEKQATRKKAEQAVAESGRRYKTLAEMSPVGIFHTDETGYTTYVNPRWCEISGMECENALGNGWLNSVHEDDKEKLLIGWIQATKARSISVSEYRFVHADGSIAWVIGQAVPEINSDDAVVGYVGTVTDITERKVAEEETKRSNIQLALSQKIAHIGYWELDLMNRPTYWSDELYRLVGMENNKIPPGQVTFLERIHPQDREMVVEAYRSFLQHQQQLNIEFRFRRDDGNICNFYTLGNLITGKNGEPLGIVGITQDITERKKYESEVFKEKQLSDSIINSLPGAFYLYTKAGKFLRWNKNFEKITKYGPDEIRNMSPVDFFDGEEKTVIEKKIFNTFTYGEEHVEANFFLKTKEKIPFYFTGIAIDYEGDSCLMGVGIDISDRVEAQEEIKRTSEQLRQLALHLQTIREEERKRIGREIHDELGQQLTAIKMDIAWIDKNIPGKTDAIQSKLKNVIGLLDGGNTTIRRILSELRSGILDDHDLLDAIEWLGKQLTSNSGIPVKFSFPEDGINVAAPVANCIFRLCQEAFTNVTRYANASLVLVTLTTHNHTIVATIEDNGVGFEPTLLRNNKSFGILGMKERVLSLGGEFELISSTGNGTKIAIRLPYLV